MTLHGGDNSVVLQLGRQLDAAAGAVLLDAVSAAVATAAERVSIDLRALRSWTEEGAATLVRCREICADLPGGLHYRTGRGPGRDALLAAYA